MTSYDWNNDILWSSVGNPRKESGSTSDIKSGDTEEPEEEEERRELGKGEK